MNATRHPPSTPGNPMAGPPRRPYVVLYEQPGIRVTTGWFTVAGNQFPVNELSNLRTARGHDPIVVRAVVATGIVLAGVGTVLSFAADVNHLSAPTYLALTVAAMVPLSVAVLGQRLRPPPFELWAQYHGMTVLLFASDDERQYGQVTRALLRAREMSRLGGVGEPLASSVNPWQLPRR